MSSPTLRSFSLKWDHFSDNLCSTFAELRTDQDMLDVTLACEDGTQINAHKVVLSSGSTVFKNLLSMKKNSIPIIYMRGLTILQLTAIVDFIYHGEVKIQQDELDGFMLLANDLQLKGLVDKGESGTKIYYKQTNPTNSKDLEQINHNESTQSIKESMLVPKVEEDTEIKNDESQEGLNCFSEIISEQTKKIGSIVLSDDLKQKMTELIEWRHGMKTTGDAVYVVSWQLKQLMVRET